MATHHIDISVWVVMVNAPHPGLPALDDAIATLGPELARRTQGPSDTHSRDYAVRYWVWEILTVWFNRAVPPDDYRAAAEWFMGLDHALMRRVRTLGGQTAVRAWAASLLPPISPPATR